MKKINQHFISEMGTMEINGPVVMENTPEVKEEVKKSGKWYEQENAFPYKEGDIAIITNINKHKGLIGRLVQIVKPSAKRNAVKAHLINPKNGALQGTMITLEFGYIELIETRSNQEEQVTA